MIKQLRKHAIWATAAGFAFGVLLTSNGLQAQTESVTRVAPTSQYPSEQIKYVNETNRVVNVLSTPVVPGGQPTIIRQLQPRQSYSHPKAIVGATLSFAFADGNGQLEQRTRPNHIGLVVFGGGPRPMPMGRTYVNRTGGVVHMFEQRGVTIPPTQPTFIGSLQPNQIWRDTPTRVSPLSFKLAGGVGQIQQRTEETLNGQLTALVRVSDNSNSGPDPGGNNVVTYINRTGQDVMVYSKVNGSPTDVITPQYETTIPAGGTYWHRSIPGSPIKSFRLAGGGSIRKKSIDSNRIELVAIGNVTPGGIGNVITYVNKTGQDVFVYSQVAGAPGFRQPPRYESTIPAGASYRQQTMPGSPTRSFRLSGGGKILQKRINDNRVELVATGMPTPGGGGNTTTYVNMTGQDVLVYSQVSGAPGFQNPAQYETTIAAGGSYMQQIIPGSPTKSFRLANGGAIVQRSVGNNRVDLVLASFPGQNNAGQGTPWQPSPVYPTPGQTYYWNGNPIQTVPPTIQFDNRVPWQPGSGNWQTVPGAGQPVQPTNSNSLGNSGG